MSNDQWGPYETPEGQPGRAASDSSQTWGDTPQNPQERQGQPQYGTTQQLVNPSETDPYGYDPYAPQQTGHPRPSVSFPTAIKLFFKNYAVFNGRASRSEFWWVFLLNVLVETILETINSRLGGTPSDPTTIYMVVSGVWEVATIVPKIALSVRRIHDTNRSGFHYFWVLLPFIGWIVLLVFYCQSSHPDAWRRYDNGTLPVEE